MQSRWPGILEQRNHLGEYSTGIFRCYPQMCSQIGLRDHLLHIKALFNDLCCPFLPSRHPRPLTSCHLSSIVPHIAASASAKLLVCKHTMSSPSWLSLDIYNLYTMLRSYVDISYNALLTCFCKGCWSAKDCVHKTCPSNQKLSMCSVSRLPLCTEVKAMASQPKVKEPAVTFGLSSH